jgi:hypothetical protein
VVLAFLDDILVLGKDFEGHLANLRAVLVRFREYGLNILANSNNPYLVINAVLEQSSGLIFTCQYAELASSLEYHTFPAKVSRHSSTRGNGNTSLMVSV